MSNAGIDDQPMNAPRGGVAADGRLRALSGGHWMGAAEALALLDRAGIVEVRVDPADPRRLAVRVPTDAR